MLDVKGHPIFKQIIEEFTKTVLQRIECRTDVMRLRFMHQRTFI